MAWGNNLLSPEESSERNWNLSEIFLVDIFINFCCYCLIIWLDFCFKCRVSWASWTSARRDFTIKMQRWRNLNGFDGDGNEMLLLIDHSNNRTAESTRNDVIIHSNKSHRDKKFNHQREIEGEISELWSLVWLQKQQIVIKENEGNLISIRQETNRCVFLLVQFSQTSHEFISLFIPNDIIFYVSTWRKLK